MVYVPVLNTVAVSFRYTLDSQLVENVINFSGTVDWTTSNMASLGGDLIDWWRANLAPLQSVDVSFREVYLLSLETASSPSVIVTTSLPDTGEESGTPLPNNATCTVTFRTAQRGRSFRGRNYVIGLTQALLSSSNTISLTTRTDYLAAYGELLTLTLTNGAKPVVVSRFSDGAPRATGLATLVTSFDMNLTLDSQRRRLPERGT